MTDLCHLKFVFVKTILNMKYKCHIEYKIINKIRVMNSPENLLGLALTDFGADTALCCPDVGVGFVGDLCVLTTGATVAVAFGLAGGFRFCGDFALLGDSSDSEEYIDGLDFGGCLSLFLFSNGGTTTVSALGLT